MFGLNELSDMNLHQCPRDGRAKDQDRAKRCRVAQIGPPAQPWPEHDDNPDQPDDNGGYSDQADLFTQHKSGKDDRKNRGGITKRRDLGQGQHAKPGECHPHCRGAKHPAPEMPARVPGRQAVAQFTARGQPDKDHRDRKEGSKEHGLARWNVFRGRLDHRRHDRKETDR